MALYFNNQLAKNVYYSGVKCQKVFFNDVIVYQAIYIPQPITPTPYSVSGVSGGVFGSMLSEDGNTCVINRTVSKWNGSAYTVRGELKPEGNYAKFIPLDNGDVRSMSNIYGTPSIVVIAVHKESNGWKSERLGTHTIQSGLDMSKFFWSPDGDHGIMVSEGSYNRDANVRAFDIVADKVTIADADALLGFRHDRNTEDDEQSFVVTYGGRWAALQDKYAKGTGSAAISRKYMSGVGKTATINVSLDKIRYGGTLKSCSPDGTWFATDGAGDVSSPNQAMLTLYKTDNTKVTFKQTGSGQKYDNEECSFLFSETGKHGVGVLSGESSSNNNTKFITATFKFDGTTWVKDSSYSVWLPSGYPSGYMLSASGCVASHLGSGRFNVYRT